MDPVRDLLLGVLLPATVAGVALLAAWLGTSPGAARARWCGMAIAAGFLAGQVAVPGLTRWPPRASSDWLAWLAIAAAVAALLPLEPIGRAERALRWLVALAAGWLGARPLLGAGATRLEGMVSLGAVAIAIAVDWAALRALSRRLDTRAYALVALALATTASLTLLAASSAALAQSAGVLTACFGAALVVASIAGRPAGHGANATATAAPAAVLYAGLIGEGRSYAELPIACALLLALAPLVLVLAEAVAPARESRLRRAAVIAVGLALALLPVLVWAVAELTGVGAHDPYARGG